MRKIIVVDIPGLVGSDIDEIKTRADDISFLIDQIEVFKIQGFYIGKISDIEHIGVFGHSFLITS